MLIDFSPFIPATFPVVVTDQVILQVKVLDLDVADIVEAEAGTVEEFVEVPAVPGG